VRDRLLVSVVDDDESVRESLPDLLKEVGYAVETFSSAEEFLESGYVQKNEMPDRRYCDASNVGSRPAKRIETPPTSHADYLHHGARNPRAAWAAC
jgi:response regulator RpfG family c-di-GMP phosphodiesterase